MGGRELPTTVNAAVVQRCALRTANTGRVTLSVSWQRRAAATLSPSADIETLKGSLHQLVETALDCPRRQAPSIHGQLTERAPALGWRPRPLLLRCALTAHKYMLVLHPRAPNHVSSLDTLTP